MQQIPATAQEYYNLLVYCSYDETFPSVDKDGDCAYRGDKTAGCKQRCAAGVLMLDDAYIPGIEGSNVSVPSVKTRLCLPSDINLGDVRMIQSTHDKLAGRIKWDAAEFLRQLSTLSCFKNVVKADPDLEPSKDSLHPQGL